MPRTRTLAETLRRLSQPDASGCLVWTGRRFGNGYGAIERAGKRLMAHRVAYELTKGPIAEGLVIDHVCRACVNPAHLEAVTHRENLLRGNGWSGRNARKTKCPQGHDLGPDRLCRECRNERFRRRHANLTPEQREAFNAEQRRRYHERKARKQP